MPPGQRLNKRLYHHPTKAQLARATRGSRLPKPRNFEDTLLDSCKPAEAEG